MKRTNQMLCLFLIAVLLLLPSCGGKSEQLIIDYGDAAAFEAALNKGENLEGKIVQFVAGELHPQSVYGYDIWAGEHLNFVSSRNPDVREGDTVIVQTTTIESALGSWIINYEKVDNAIIGDATIFSNSISDPLNVTEDSDAESAAPSGGSASFAANNQAETEKPLELVDCGFYINPLHSDTAYINFCGIIHNPNDTLIATFPTVVITVRNSDNQILATDDQVGSIVMPGDTITLVGMFSMAASDITEDAVIYFDAEWSDFEQSSSFYSNARTSDFAITNVSERASNDKYFITGEITNNYTEDIDDVNLSLVLRKDGEIIYMENTFIDNMKVGKTKAFEFSRYSDWPEHDTIEISALVW